MSPEQKQELHAMLQRHCKEIAEHFEAVQILVSTTIDNGGTVDLSHGSGNWYARVGMCRELLMRDEARTFFHEDPSNDDEDDGEEPESKL